MKDYTLKIAGYNIRFEASEESPELIPSERFLRNIIQTPDYDILIRVHHGTLKLSEEADRVFIAPYIIEAKGMKIKLRDHFWSVYKHHSDLYIFTNFPDSSHGKKALLKFSLTLREWDLWLEGTGEITDPFEYPVDSLVLYYLTVIHSDIMIHASGVNYAGKGYLFSGASGKGKTTLAELWEDSGAKVIHDDRLILRNINGTYRMFNTPVYRDDEPRESPLNKIFIIEHGTENKIIPVKGATAVTLVMANCIQQNWDPEVIAPLLGSVSTMCSMIPTVKLFFRPERRIIDYILEYE